MPSPGSADDGVFGCSKKTPPGVCPVSSLRLRNASRGNLFSARPLKIFPFSMNNRRFLTGFLLGSPLAALVVLTIAVTSFPPASNPGALQGQVGGSCSNLAMGSEIDFPTAPMPSAVAAVDVNGDGRKDMAVANYDFSNDTYGSVLVYINTGGGAYASAVEYRVGTHPRTIASGDFNGDGKQDLVLGTTVNVTVLMNNGNGTFAAPVDYFTNTPVSVATGDFTGDGKADVVAIANGTLYVLVNNGDGTFGTPRNYGTGTQSNSFLAVADFDADGRKDIAYTNIDSASYGYNVSVLLNKGGSYINSWNVGFAPVVMYPLGTAVSPLGIAVGDLNGDGKQDIASADHDPSIHYNVASVFINTGNGTFAPVVHYKAGGTFGQGNVYGIAIGDLSCDGKNDIAVANEDNNTIGLLANKGDGTFAPVTYAQATTPRAFLTISDLNGDGRQDLIAPAFNSSWVTVLPGVCSCIAGQPPPITVASSSSRSSSSSSAVSSVKSSSSSSSSNSSVSQGSSSSITNVVLSTVSAPSCGAGGFAAKVDYPAEDTVNDITAADFNGDGKTDFATANNNAYTISSFLNTGNGTFAPKANYPAPPGTLPRAIVAGNFKGYGKPDVVTANYLGGASVFFNNGGGGFPPNRMDMPVQEEPNDVVAANFNGNIRDGFAVVNYVTGSISVVNGAGNTFLARVDYPTGAHPVAAAAADFNVDGKPDLAVVGSTLSILRNNGGGGFVPKVDYPAGAGNDVAAADFNGDGKPDLAIAKRGQKSVLILLNNGDGTFDTGINYTTGMNAYHVTAADFNGDGKPDLAVADYDTNTVAIIINTGNGTFSSMVKYPTGKGPLSTTAGDFNADGKPDLGVVNYGASTVSILLNNGVACAGSSSVASLSSSAMSQGSSAGSSIASSVGSVSLSGSSGVSSVSSSAAGSTGSSGSSGSSGSTGSSGSSNSQGSSASGGTSSAGTGCAAGFECSYCPPGTPCVAWECGYAPTGTPFSMYHTETSGTCGLNGQGVCRACVPNTGSSSSGASSNPYGFSSSSSSAAGSTGSSGSSGSTGSQGSAGSSGSVGSSGSSTSSKSSKSSKGSSSSKSGSSVAGVLATQTCETQHGDPQLSPDCTWVANCPLPIAYQQIFASSAAASSGPSVSPVPSVKLADLPVCHPICGDGIKIAPEKCDDGNTLNGDGCDQYCFCSPGQQLYYKFDNNADDESGRYPGALNGTSWEWSDDVPSQMRFPDPGSLFFGDGNDSRVDTQVPYSPIPPSTISLWLKFEAFAGPGTTGRGSFSYLDILPTEYVQDNPSLQIHYVSLNVYSPVVYYNGAKALEGGTITPDLWHHLAVTNDGTITKIYLDGAEVASGNSPAAAQDFLSIGGRPDLSDIHLQNAGLDDIRFYPEVLKGNQIAYLAGGNSIRLPERCLPASSSSSSSPAVSSAGSAGSSASGGGSSGSSSPLPIPAPQYFATCKPDGDVAVSGLPGLPPISDFDTDPGVEIFPNTIVQKYSAIAGMPSISSDTVDTLKTNIGVLKNICAAYK